MRRLNTITEKELLEIWDLVYISIHSEGFKKAEIKDLFTENYYFLEKPKHDWKNNVISYLKENNLEIPNTSIFK